MEIGELIKIKRQEKHQTVRQLAEATGLSVGAISQIENGKVAPNVITLKSIAKALKTSVTYFLRDDEENISLVKKADRKIMVRNKSIKGNVIEEFLTIGKAFQMNPGIIITQPGDNSGEFVGHTGEEFILVLQGTIDLTLENINTYHLEEGDTLYYPCSIPHYWENKGKEESRFLIVATPPFL